VTARSSNHSFPDGWLVMLQRICPVRSQSGRNPEFEHPEHSGGYVLRSGVARKGCTTGIRLDGPDPCRFPRAVLSFPHPSENPEIWGPGQTTN
jgi:hypothetical protein